MCTGYVHSLCNHTNSLSPYMFLSEQVIGIPFDFVSEKDVLGLTNASHQTSPGAGKDADGIQETSTSIKNDKEYSIIHRSLSFVSDFLDRFFSTQMPTPSPSPVPTNKVWL